MLKDSPMSEKNTEKRVFVGVYLPESLARRLKSTAALAGKSKQDLHNELLVSAFSKYESGVFK